MIERDPAVRTVIASNRGPVSYRREADGGLRAQRGGGGLVSALSSLGAGDDILWICAAMSDADREAAAARDRLSLEGAGPAVRMLDIDPEVFSQAYDGIANSTLWFLHHLLFDLPTEPVFDAAFRQRWQAYRDYNRSFAEAVAEEAAPGASVLLQDYHLTLAPAMLRDLRTDLRIGHFSHTPWAPAATFAILPADLRDELLRGVLGADRAGFLSPRWAADFTACCTGFLGATADGDTLTVAGHTTALAVHALGVDPEPLRARAAEADVTEALQEFAFPGLQMIGRVDRSELSKNIVRGLHAVAELLRTQPQFRERVVHVAVVYPSRGGLPAYQRYLHEIETVAREINAELGTPTWQPIVLHLDDDYGRSLAVLRRSDVLLVNPVRDGMNLVAKEGPLLGDRAPVLVLSQEAGAADELDAALLVAPFDVSATAAALGRALTMDSVERAERSASLRAAASALPPGRWLGDQLEALDRS